MNEKDAEQYVDVVGVIMADSADIDIKGKLLHSYVDDGHSIGIRALAWAGRVYLVAGTDDDDSRVTVGQELSPGKARDLAETLKKAADKAEAKADSAEIDEPEENKSFLRYVMEKVRL